MLRLQESGRNVRQPQLRHGCLCNGTTGGLSGFTWWECNKGAGPSKIAKCRLLRSLAPNLPEAARVTSVRILTFTCLRTVLLAKR